MKHGYLLTLYGYDEEDDLYYATGFAKCNQQALTKADIVAIIEDSKSTVTFSCTASPIWGT